MMKIRNLLVVAFSLITGMNSHLTEDTTFPLQVDTLYPSSIPYSFDRHDAFLPPIADLLSTLVPSEIAPRPPLDDMPIGIYPESPVTVPNSTFCETKSFEFTTCVRRPVETTKIDIFFLIDSTASMGGVIDTIMTTFNAIIEELSTVLPSADIQYGVGNYRDFTDRRSLFKVDQPITNDLSAVQLALDSLDGDGGGDTPEAAFEGLYRSAMQGGFRSSAYKIIFLATDACSQVSTRHGENPLRTATITGAGGSEVPGIDFTCGIATNGRVRPFRASVQQTIDVLNDKGIRVVGVRSRARGPTEVEKLLQGVAKLTGSNLVLDISTSAKDFVDAVVDSVETVIGLPIDVSLATFIDRLTHLEVIIVPPVAFGVKPNETACFKVYLGSVNPTDEAFDLSFFGAGNQQLGNLTVIVEDCPQTISSAPHCSTDGPPVPPTSIPTPTLPTPTFEPTVRPSAELITKPSRPTSQPSHKPSPRPSANPTSNPTNKPSPEPTAKPTSKSTTKPSSEPSTKPTSQPTNKPSFLPSASPTSKPSPEPSAEPSWKPTTKPSHEPSTKPTLQPTNEPSTNPTFYPTSKPTAKPSPKPTGTPSSKPTAKRSPEPSLKPTSHSTNQPTTKPSPHPTIDPTSNPTTQPSRKLKGTISPKPTNKPTNKPTSKPTTNKPTTSPTRRRNPTKQPIQGPTIGVETPQPVLRPTNKPECEPEHSSSPTLGLVETPNCSKELSFFVCDHGKPVFEITNKSVACLSGTNSAMQVLVSDAEGFDECNVLHIKLEGVGPEGNAFVLEEDEPPYLFNSSYWSLKGVYEITATPIFSGDIRYGAARTIYFRVICD